MVYVWLALSLLLLYLTYFFYFKPKKLCQHYAKILRERGYKVYEFPFRPFGVPVYDNLQRNTEQKNDAVYSYKQFFQGYDVIVSNLLYHPHLVFLNLKLGRDMISAEKVLILPKIYFMFKMVIQKFGDGLVFVEGEKWKNQRRLISKAFTFDFLIDLVPRIVQVCDAVFDQLQAQNKAKGKEERLQSDLFKTGSQIFSSVTIGSFLGMNSFHEKIEGLPAHQYAQEVGNLAFQVSIDPLIMLLGVWFYKLGLKKDYRTLEATYQKLKTYAQAKLSEIRSNFESLSPEQQKLSKNLVHSLLYHSKAEGNSSDYQNEELIQQIIIFTAAGSDLTSSLFSMMLLMISDHSEVERRLREEINASFKTKEDFSFDKLKKLEFIDWIQLQVLRLFTPAVGIFDRVATTDITIGDVSIKAGTALKYIQTTNFYDNNIFQDARTFRPERWASKDFGTNQLLNLVMLQFSGGPRSCIGKNLALLQSKIAVIKFMQRYQNIRLVSERKFMMEIAYHLKNGSATFTKVI